MKTKIIKYGAYPNVNTIVRVTRDLTSLTRYENIFTYPEEDNGYDARYDVLGVVFKIESVYIFKGTFQRWLIEDGEDVVKWEEERNLYIETVKAKAKLNYYINLLEIEVFKELGLDTSLLLQARKIALQKREEKRKKEAEEEAKQEAIEAAQVKEAEEKEAARLSDVKQNFVEGKTIAGSDFLKIVQLDGVKPHIRTMGTIRKRIVAINKKGELRVTLLKGKQPDTTGVGKLLRSYCTHCNISVN